MICRKCDRFSIRDSLRDCIHVSRTVLLNLRHRKLRGASMEARVQLFNQFIELFGILFIGYLFRPFDPAFFFLAFCKEKKF